jgi:hypothetical protein
MSHLRLVWDRDRLEAFARYWRDLDGWAGAAYRAAMNPPTDEEVEKGLEAIRKMKRESRRGS